MEEINRYKYQKGKIEQLNKDNEINILLVKHKEIADKYLRKHEKELKKEIEEKIKETIEDVCKQIQL